MTTAPHADDNADLVDRLFDYLLQMQPTLADDPAKFLAMKSAVRDEFAGTDVYLRRREKSDRLAAQVLSLFNGRNATEVARCLRISRATVYRLIKQPGSRP